MHKYRLLSKKGEGTFSEVLKAQSIRSGKHVAIKCMKNHFDSIEQVNNLREIQALRRLAGHPNIIKLHEVLYDEPTGRLALVFELMDMNLYEAIKGRRHYLPEKKVREYMYATLKALDHMHRNGIFHRDVKPENLLLLDDEIKLADLGSCRGIYSRQPFTEYISTRWYRAPECLLTDGYYNFKMDLFAAGTVFFEIVALFPLFPGQNEMDQVQKIHNVLGTPSPELVHKFKRNASHMDFNFPEKKGSGIDRLIPHAEPDLLDLMKKLIRYDPDERILARQALKDNYFRELRDAEKDPSGCLAGPTLPVGGSGGSRNRDTSLNKVGMSSSSSAASIMEHDVPEQTQEIPERVRGVSPNASTEERGGLPNIGERRKHRGSVGGGAGGDSEDGHEHDESTVLPPIAIGGIKAKRDGKSKSQTHTLKNAANASLQKTTMTVHGSMAGHHGAAVATGSHPPGFLSTSKGFSGSLGGAAVPSSTSKSSTDAMSSTNPHSWAGTKDHGRGVSPGGSAAAAAAEKMSSTWAPNHGHQRRQNDDRYVTPFGAKIALGAGRRR
mmetsp:Transcript_58168/g.125744  ORF Transcript_58168/g.125744 Transcript_58168/m.125744 type:complete len:553 (+) Transcript_58168:92-1750(+)